MMDLRNIAQAVAWGDMWMRHAIELEAKLRTAEARISLLETIVDNLEIVSRELERQPSRKFEDELPV